MKIIEGIVFPVIATIIVLIVTPLGDTLRDFLFPPQFAVEGIVKRSNDPIPFLNIRISEDEEFEDRTNLQGKFIIENVVPAGCQSYVVLNNTRALYGDEFHLSKNTLEENLGEIELSASPVEEVEEQEDCKQQQIQESSILQARGQIQLQQQAEINPAFEEEGKQADYSVFLAYQDNPSTIAPNFHNITVWVNASQQTLSLIDRVTYYLHPTLEPNIVTQYSRNDNFALSFDALGQFKIAAKVYFKDNQVKDLSGNIVFH